MKKVLEKIFGGLNVNWSKLIIFAVIMGIYTGIVAMLVPDGNSFHDIAVTGEWWVLPAVLIMVNTKGPLESALKVFAFFLISQPLVYLVEVPFNSMGWGLFSYYKYWFFITLLTFPAAFIGWYLKKDKWYSGLILSVATVFLVRTGYIYFANLPEDFPNHLLSAVYCFAIIPIFIYGIFRSKAPRIITAVISLAALLIMPLLGVERVTFEAYKSSIFEDNGITLVGKPSITYQSGKDGEVAIIEYDEGYNFKLSGKKGQKYYFTVEDGSGNQYSFEYYSDEDQQTVVVNLYDSPLPLD